METLLMIMLSKKCRKTHGQDEVFLITQYYVNGWIANGGNDDLAAMRVGKAPYSIDPDKNILNVNGRSYKYQLVER